MDPDATLDRVRALAHRILQSFDLLDGPTDAHALAEAVCDLDEWLTRGGFAPAAWRREVTIAARPYDHERDDA